MGTAETEPTAEDYAEAAEEKAEQPVLEGMPLPAPADDPEILELRRRATELRGVFLARVTEASDQVEGAKAHLNGRRDILAALCAAALENGVDVGELAEASGYSRGTLQQWAREARPE